MAPNRAGALLFKKKQPSMGEGGIPKSPVFLSPSGWVVVDEFRFWQLFSHPYVYSSGLDDAAKLSSPPSFPFQGVILMYAYPSRAGNNWHTRKPSVRRLDAISKQCFHSMHNERHVIGLLQVLDRIPKSIGAMVR